MLIPPNEASIEVASRVIEYKPNPSRMEEIGFKSRSEVGLRITAQRVGAKVEAYP